MCKCHICKRKGKWLNRTAQHSKDIALRLFFTYILWLKYDPHKLEWIISIIIMWHLLGSAPNKHVDSKGLSGALQYFITFIKKKNCSFYDLDIILSYIIHSSNSAALEFSLTAATVCFSYIPFPFHSITPLFSTWSRTFEEEGHEGDDWRFQFGDGESVRPVVSRWILSPNTETASDIWNSLQTNYKKTDFVNHPSWYNYCMHVVLEVLVLYLSHFLFLVKYFTITIL